MRARSEIWMNGYKAAKANVALCDCIYNYGAPDYQEFAAGWRGFHLDAISGTQRAYA